MALHPQARQAIEDAAGELPVTDPSYDIGAARQQARVAAAAQEKVEVAEVHAQTRGGRGVDRLARDRRTRTKDRPGQMKGPRHARDATEASHRRLGVVLHAPAHVARRVG